MRRLNAETGRFVLGCPEILHRARVCALRTLCLAKVVTSWYPPSGAEGTGHDVLPSPRSRSWREGVLSAEQGLKTVYFSWPGSRDGAKAMQHVCGVCWAPGSPASSRLGLSQHLHPLHQPVPSAAALCLCPGTVPKTRREGNLGECSIFQRAVESTVRHQDQKRSFWFTICARHRVNI